MYSRRRKKNPYFKPIGDVLADVLKKRQINLPTKDPHLWKAWEASVGPLIAAQTAVDRLKNDVLFVKVSNSVWMQQLQFMKKDILEKFNASFGKGTVQNIFFTLGPISALPLKEESISSFQGQETLSEKDTMVIERWASAVQDPELSGILKRIMTKDLKRRKEKA